MSTALSTRARAIRLYRCVRLRFDFVGLARDRACVASARGRNARFVGEAIDPSIHAGKAVDRDRVRGRNADETTRARGGASANEACVGGFVNRANGRDRTRMDASFERLTVRDSARFACRLGLRCARF